MRYEGGQKRRHHFQASKRCRDIRCCKRLLIHRVVHKHGDINAIAEIVAFVQPRTQEMLSESQTAADRDTRV